MYRAHLERETINWLLKPSQPRRSYQGDRHIRNTQRTGYMPKNMQWHTLQHAMTHATACNDTLQHAMNDTCHSMPGSETCNDMSQHAWKWNMQGHVTTWLEHARTCHNRPETCNDMCYNMKWHTLQHAMPHPYNMQCHMLQHAWNLQCHMLHCLKPAMSHVTLHQTCSATFYNRHETRRATCYNRHETCKPHVTTGMKPAEPHVTTGMKPAEPHVTCCVVVRGGGVGEGWCIFMRYSA